MKKNVRVWQADNSNSNKIYITSEKDHEKPFSNKQHPGINLRFNHGQCHLINKVLKYDSINIRFHY